MSLKDIRTTDDVMTWLGAVGDTKTAESIRRSSSCTVGSRRSVEVPMTFRELAGALIGMDAVDVTWTSWRGTVWGCTLYEHSYGYGDEDAISGHVIRGGSPVSRDAFIGLMYAGVKETASNDLTDYPSLTRHQRGPAPTSAGKRMDGQVNPVVGVVAQPVTAVRSSGAGPVAEVARPRGVSQSRGRGL